MAAIPIDKLDKQINIENISIEKHVVDDKARGITKLDKNLFKCTVKVLGISVPVKNVALFKKSFKTSVFKMTNVKPVVELDESDEDRETHRVVLIDPNQYSSPDEFTFKHFPKLTELNVHQTSCKYYVISLDYTNWNYDEILKWILPKIGVDGIGGFSIIGHIAHLNLKDELLPYKSVIGEVILDKVNAVTTVINKLQTIDNTFRNFKMELLAGVNDFKTTTKEHGFTYEFDFSKVYWNPRLATEHQRIVEWLSPNDVLFDVFAGVGPFVIPAAKKGCQVYANDLNPDSFHWMKRNFNINKISPKKYNVYNLDGREFIRTTFKDALVKENKSGNCAGTMYHILMNLPALAMEFLDAFRDLFRNNIDDNDDCNNDKSMKHIDDGGGVGISCSSNVVDMANKNDNNNIPDNNMTTITGNKNVIINTDNNSKIVGSTNNNDIINITNDIHDINNDDINNNIHTPPTNNDNNNSNNGAISNIVIHCYSFSKAADPESDVINQVKQRLDLETLTFYKLGIRRVRNVAPNKEMMCVSFHLPYQAMVRGVEEKHSNVEGNNRDEPLEKRLKL